MKSATNLQNNIISRGFTLEKRFDSEFEKIEKIGRGGFSSVYKVRNILDNSFYAIKKIKLKIDKKNRNLQKDISNVLQEIRYLAKLKSDYIVNYNHSWVEVNLKVERNNFKSYRDYKNKDPETYLDEYYEPSNSKSNSNDDCCLEFENYKDSKYSQVSLVFVEESEVSKKLNSMVSLGSESEESDENINDNFINIGNNLYSCEEIESISIFIQMELCRETLGDWIERRNKKYHQLSKKSLKNMHMIQLEPILTKNDEIEEVLHIFENILSGVEYIHSKEKLIHRDLKPNNIFFTFEDHIKIGDLGLATNSLKNKWECLCPSPINSVKDQNEDHFNDEDDLGLDSSFQLEINETGKNPSINFIDFDFLNNNVKFDIQLMEHDSFNEKDENEIHTSNIGTAQYAAPEQLNNNYYDNKVDIYSLGLILLELVFPFKTSMERLDVQQNLKNKKLLPKLIKDRFIKVHDLIITMCETDPSKRPNITECRVILQNSINHDSSNKSNEILNLEKSLSPLVNWDSKLYDRLLKTNKIRFSFFDDKKRRFSSEDFSSIQSYQFWTKIEADEWKKIWVKTFNEKLLIYFKENSHKANIIYDLKECTIKGSYIYHNDFQQYFNFNKSNSNSNVRLINELKIAKSSLLKRRKSSDDVNATNTSTIDEENENSRLNYLIEIFHPYQQKCVLKGEHIFEAIEFYKKLIKINE